MTALTTSQRAMYGRMGAAIARARHNPADLTAEARKRFLSRFEDQARTLHPDADEAEVQRVATQLKRAHFLSLAAASSRARSKKAVTSPKVTAEEVESDRSHTTAKAA